MLSELISFDIICISEHGANLKKDVCALFKFFFAAVLRTLCHDSEIALRVSTLLFASETMGSEAEQNGSCSAILCILFLK